MRCIFKRIAASLAVAVLLVPALAAQQSTAGRNVTRLNNEVLSVYTRSVRARGERPALRQQARELLEEREQALADLAAQSPDEALDAALPANLAADLARAFPESSALVERHGSLIGILETEVEDGEDLREYKVIRHIRVGRDRFRVHFSDDAPIAESGSLVQLNGMLVGETMVAESSDLTSANAAAQSCSTTGAQRLAVLKVRPPEVTASLANSTLDNWMFGSSGMTVNNYWQENSRGAAWAEGDVYPSGADAWYTLDREYSCSESSALRDAAMDAADADVNYNNYQRVVIVFPKPSSGCSFAGRASVGCWVSSPDGNSVSYALQVLTSMGTAQKAVQLTTHEGGHTLGLSHASTVDYGSEPLGATNDSGSKAEYGDRYSSMGFWTDGHYSAPHKDRLNWISSQYVSSAGSFVIKPYSSASGTTALEIKRGSSGSQSLWIEYRRQLGDFNAGPPDSPTNGALIHLNGGSSSLLLDFTPGTKTGGSTTPNDFLDAPLQSGQTWEDPYSDLAIQIGTASNSGLQVNVSYGNTPTCSTNPPTISVSPNSQSADYPAAASYSVLVNNNDNSACNSSSFTITSNALFNSQSTGEVSTSVSNQVLTISPGSSGSTTLTATPTVMPTDARNYVVSAQAARSNPSESATDTAGFTVIPPLQCQVGLPSISVSPGNRSATYPSSVSYTVTVGNNDNSACDSSSFALNSDALLNGQPTGAVNPVLAATSLSIAPGATRTTTVTVTPTQAPTQDLNYQIAAQASRSNPAQSVADQSTFTVLAPPVCAPGLPTVSLSPSGRTVEYPAPASYTMTVVNNDDNACTTSAFSVTSNATGGVSTSVSSPTLNIAPGATMSITVVATPTTQPTQTTSYTVSAGVVRSNPAQTVVDQSVLTVVPPAVCAINLPTLTVSPTSMSAQYPNPVTYAVTLTNNDSNACTTSTFSLSSNTLLNGVTTSEVSSAVTSPGLSIAPGGSATTTIVATPITLPAQSRAYIITAGASRAGQPGAAQGAVGFTVVPPPPPPPPTAVSTVQISVVGNRGSVAVSPLGLNCKDNCTITLNEAEWQTLTLQAVPSGQSCVQAIRGCEAGGGNSCTLAAGVSYEIEVEFARCSRSGGSKGGGKGRVKRLAETTDATSTGRGRVR